MRMIYNLLFYRCAIFVDVSAASDEDCES